MVKSQDGLIRMERRVSEVASAAINRSEKESFQTGKKLIAIISDVSSTSDSIFLSYYRYLASPFRLL